MLTLVSLVLSAVITPRAEPGETIPMSINGVWGDTSWSSRYGRLPDPSDDPGLRVRVHLEAVYSRLVDTVTDLDPGTAGRRHEALAALARYIDAGRFPRNVDDVGARPEFIDHEGRLCAVGAMIAETDGVAAAEALDELHHRDSVWAMDTPLVAAWATRHGFTTTELAFIQPAYTPEWFHPRTHTDQVFGARVGLSTWGTSTYENSFEGLTHTDEPALDLAAWWIWQPGLHWGLGAAVNVRGELFDYYEGSRPAVSILLKAEYAEPIAGRGLFDLLVVAEAGPIFVPGSPGDFAGVELGGGLGFASTLGLNKSLSFRLDVRAQHYLLWGASDQAIEGTQLLATMGGEWRL